MISFEKQHIILSSADRNGDTPLTVACSFGYHEICKFLIEKGASLTYTNHEGNLPIHMATRNGHLELVKYLFRINEDQLNFKDEKETDLILIATQSGQYEVFKYLLSQNIDKHCKDENGNNILISACKIGNIEMVSLILKFDFNIHIKNHCQNTALHEASAEGHVKMVEYLIRHGSVLTENIYNQSPLNLAINNHHWETVQFFLNDSNWRKTMDFRFSSGKTHIEDLIIHNEDVTWSLLDRGITLIQDNKFSEDFSMKYEFSLIDGGPDDSESVSKRYHGLMTMAKYKKEKLLNHPLTMKLIERKWFKYGKFFFISDVVIYIFYLILMSYVFTIHTPPSDVAVIDNITGCISRNSSLETVTRLENGNITVNFFIYGILILRFYIELLKIIGKRFRYFMQIENYVFLLLYGLTILFLWNPTNEPCLNQWYFGTFAILLAWLNLMFYSQSIPIIGILTLMFKNVVKNVIMIQLVFLNVMIGFAFAFNIVNRLQLPFQNIGSAYVKIIDMLIGEMDYVQYFVTQKGNFMILKLVLALLFLITMPIALINLMVGVAVGDIDQMTKNASMNLKICQIDYLYDAESILPKVSERKLYEAIYVKKCKRSLDSHYIFMDEVNTENTLVEIDERLSNIEHKLQSVTRNLDKKG